MSFILLNCTIPGKTCFAFNRTLLVKKKAYRRLLDKIAAPATLKRTQPWLRIAALLLITIPALFLLYTYNKPAAQKKQVTAEIGRIKKILLSDGTAVCLNAGSTLKYDAGFGITNRIVYLEGEAFFDIGHGKSKLPFVVHTKNYTVRDIGTKFNLKAYPNDPFLETTVISGLVAVDDNSGINSSEVNRIFVKPRQVLRIYYHPLTAMSKTALAYTPDDSFNEASIVQVDSSKLDVYDGWKDDLLVFDGSTLQDLAKVLERRYNVNITIDAPKLRQIRYSGSFKGIDDIKDVLEIIGENTPIAYSIKGQDITITKTTDHF